MLKQRNLLIGNYGQALEQLRIISYFRLANYLRPMEQDKVTHTFKPNSHFENAIDLYYFDKKLRALIFTTIQSFEVALRSKLIHHCSLKYGAFWVIDRGLFSDKKIFQTVRYVFNRKFIAQKKISYRNISTNTIIRLFLLHGKP